MANIKQFDAPSSLGLQPTEIGVEATAGAARRIGAFYNQVAGSVSDTGSRLGGALKDAGDAYVKYQDHKQIDAFNANFAKAMDGLSQDWDQTFNAADPNDPSVVNKWRTEKLEPTLAKLADGATTENAQAHAEAQIDKYRQHMFLRTSADMSKRAGDMIAVNREQTRNSYSSMVYRDPSALDFVLSSSDKSLDGAIRSSPTLSASDGARARTELSQKDKETYVRAAVLGAVNNGGDWKRIADDPKYQKYIKPDEIHAFVRAEQQEQRMRKQEERSAQAERDHTARLDFNKQVNELEAATFPDKPGDQPQLPDNYFARLRELKTHPGAAQEPGRLRAMGDQGEAISRRLDKPEPRQAVSSASWLDFMRAMRNPDLDHEAVKTKIVEAYGEGQLTRPDYSNLRQELEGLRTPEGSALMREHSHFFKRYESTIDPGVSTGLQTPMGQQNLFRAETDALSRARQMMREGKDWRAVYTPGTPEFFGNPDNLAKYRATLQEELKDKGERLKSDTLKRVIPPGAVQMLRNNPTMRGDFDAKYGAGQADKILGK